MKLAHPNSKGPLASIAPLAVAALLLAAATTSRAGTMFVPEGNDRTVGKYVATGAFLGVFASDPSQPHGLAFERARNLFAANYYSGAIIKFTPKVGSVFAWGNEPLFIATKVPRPSTLVLTGLGFAALMISRRRRLWACNPPLEAQSRTSTFRHDS